MSETIVMPQIGQDTTSAFIANWVKKENDRIEEGDIICEVEGDKGIFEVESDVSGVILKILHKEGEEVNVLEPIAYVGEPGEEV